MCGKLFLCFSLDVLLLFSFFCKSDLHPALALIPGTEGTYIIVNIDEFIDEEDCLTETIVLACTRHSKRLNYEDRLSSTKNILFIEKIIDKTSLADHNLIQICRNKVMPSMATNPETNDLEIGYKIYDENNLLQRYKLYPMSKLENMDENVGWVRILVVRSWDSSKSENYILYELNSPDSKKNEDDFCSSVRKQNHDFGEANNDQCYSEKQQKALLRYKSRKGLKFFPTSKTSRDYFVKAYFASHNSFNTYYAKIATCFDINSTPMWESIFKGSWKKVDQFIINTRNELPKHNFKIYKGTHGVLQSPVAEDGELPLYLDPHTKQIYVPEVYWIFVNSTSYELEMVDYGILIIIHNDLHSTSIQPICNDVCEKYGWDVNNNDFSKGVTYCCEIEQEIMKALSISYFQIIQVMNLKVLLAS